MSKKFHPNINYPTIIEFIVKKVIFPRFTSVYLLLKELYFQDIPMFISHHEL